MARRRGKGRDPERDREGHPDEAMEGQEDAPEGGEPEPEEASESLRPQEAAPEDGEARPVMFYSQKDADKARWDYIMVIAFGLLLFVPGMGSYGLWDPWETHYGEVAREMIDREDWISTHWEHEWFWSKPVLIFWLMGLAMKLLFAFGGGQEEVFHMVEWAVRAPFTLLSLFGLFFVYHMVSRLMNRRTALLSVGMLATSPFFFFIGRQAMTDMSFVALITGAISCFLLAQFGKHEEEMKPLGFWILVGFFVIGTLPQYLLLGIELDTSILRFRLGESLIKITTGHMHFLAYFLPWAGLLYLFFRSKERRPQKVYMYAFYYLAGLACLGKGLLGLALPGAIILTYLIVTWDWKLLKRCEIHFGAVIFLITSLPWYLSMYLRHGQGFFNRLFVHDHFKRIASGVHCTDCEDATFVYFLQQLGYGIFPWVAFVPSALSRMIHKRFDGDDSKAKVKVFIFIWFAFTFMLFSLSLTKFHHYIFPAVVPLIILVAAFVDELLDGKVKFPALHVAALVGLMILIARDLDDYPPNALINLFTYMYDRPWPREYDPSTTISIIAASAVAMASLMFIPRIRKYALLGVLLVGVAFAEFGINSYMPSVSPHWSQKDMFMAYWKLRKPGERIWAYKMNWRGETFYSRNTNYAATTDKEVEKFFKQNGGKKWFCLVEHGRLNALKAQLPTQAMRDNLKIEHSTNIKFYLVSSHD